MKTRIGFISNSSSTSFIIAVKKSNPCKHCGRSDPDFLALLPIKDDYGNSDQTELESVSIDGIVKGLKEYDYDGSGRPHIIKQILAYKDKPEFKVAQIKISYHDDIYNEMLKQGIKSGNIIELYNLGD